MKIFELFNPNMKREEFDLHDDLIFFMRNDPKFYRSDYHPFQQKFNRHCNAGRSVSAKAFAPIVHKAFDQYKDMFPVEGLEDKLTERDMQEICEKLQGQETNYYHEDKKKTAEKKDDIKRAI
jgi:hypothetical protein